jgi:hypothetical protein
MGEVGSLYRAVCAVFCSLFVFINIQLFDKCVAALTRPITTTFTTTTKRLVRTCVCATVSPYHTSCSRLPPPFTTSSVTLFKTSSRFSSSTQTVDCQTQSSIRASKGCPDKQNPCKPPFFAQFCRTNEEKNGITPEEVKEGGLSSRSFIRGTRIFNFRKKL